MANRKSSRMKILSPLLQGEDSYVVVTLPTVAEVRALAARDLTGMEGFTEGEALVKIHVLEWNWVDDDGKPLPSPVQDSTVVDRLTTDEFKWLTQVLLGDESARKNS